MDTILIVDDEVNYLTLLRSILEEEGYEILTAERGSDAISILENSDIDLIISDIIMPEMDGLQLLETVRSGWPDIPIIMMTAHGSVEKAVEAMHMGAFTFIQKPFDYNRMVIFANKAITHSKVIQENKRLRNVVKSHYSFGNIIGKSKIMKTIMETVDKVAPTSSTVLIEGESGTGKELIARSIHYNSHRKNNSLIAFNCAALAENLIESELFGHEKGAFTGATSMKKGRFELADKGTLFLDEIGELSMNLQVKLLRVIQEMTFERVGGTNPIKVNVRLIAATNKILKDLVAQGRFREDLYYRLHVVHIQLPPLRKRPEDIHLLAHHFLKKLTVEKMTEKKIKGFSPECERILLESKWPGNIRQLENSIESAMVMCSGEYITPRDFPQDIFNSTTPLHDESNRSNLDVGLYEALADFERNLIEQALLKAGGVQVIAAKLLKIGKSGLNQKIKKLGIDITRFAV